MKLNFLILIKLKLVVVVSLTQQLREVTYRIKKIEYVK